MKICESNILYTNEEIYIMKEMKVILMKENNNEILINEEEEANNENIMKIIIMWK